MDGRGTMAVGVSGGGGCMNSSKLLNLDFSVFSICKVGL